MTDWNNYYRRFGQIESRLLAAMNAAATEFGTVAERHDTDDYGFAFDVERGKHGKHLKLAVTLTMIDSGDVETGEPDKAGNLMIELIEDGGRVVGNFSPDNYTDDCWANYIDDETWELKVARVEDAAAISLPTQIKEWQGGRI